MSTRVVSSTRGFLLACLAVAPLAAGCGNGGALDDSFNSLCDGPAANTTPGGSRPATPPHVTVHMLRGLGDIYSQGLNVLADEMKSLGIDATAHSDPGWQLLGIQIANDYKSSDNPKGIVLLGHSYGADDAVRMCEYLKDQGVPVRLLILLDATNPPPIPSNVDRCVHFYIPWPAGDAAPGVLPGHPVSAADDNKHTQIVNDSLGLEGSNPADWCISHLGIDASQRIHSKILDEVYGL